MLLIETSVKILNRQHKVKDMQLTKSKTKLDKEHKEKLKVQVDLKLTTDRLVVVKNQLAKVRLVANWLTTCNNLDYMANMPNMSTVDTSSNYQPRGSNPKNQFIETDCSTYVLWR